MTIRNPFKQDELIRTFDTAVQLFSTRHSNLFTAGGQPHRSNGVASPFWQGYFDEPVTTIPKGTLAFAYYRAGQACHKEYMLSFANDGKLFPLSGQSNHQEQNS